MGLRTSVAHGWLLAAQTPRITTQTPLAVHHAEWAPNATARTNWRRPSVSWLGVANSPAPSSQFGSWANRLRRLGSRPNSATRLLQTYVPAHIRVVNYSIRRQSGLSQLLHAPGVLEPFLPRCFALRVSSANWSICVRPTLVPGYFDASAGLSPWAASEYERRVLGRSFGASPASGFSGAGCRARPQCGSMLTAGTEIFTSLIGQRLAEHFRRAGQRRYRPRAKRWRCSCASVAETRSIGCIAFSMTSSTKSTRRLAMR